jgi:RHS repeat-associated protein
MYIGFDGSTYIYDAQNRLTSATTGSVTMTFKYDGLNRQVSRTVNGLTTYNVYDGWNLMGEYANGATTPSAGYIHGVGGLIKEKMANNYYYQDGSGSTSHLADHSGLLLESYLYDLEGLPGFYDPNGNPLSASAYGVRHLFTGQQWYQELGLYDLRNRFYSPDIGRFLQPDPIGFHGDRTNLYRYARNNPMKWSDPFGTCGGGGTPECLPDGRGGSSDGAWYPPQHVTAPDPGILTEGGFLPGEFQFGGSDNPEQMRLLEQMNEALARMNEQSSAPNNPQSSNPPTPVDPNPSAALSSGSVTQAQITSQVLQAVVVTYSFGGQYMPRTLIKNEFQAAILRRPQFSRVPIFVPPGIDPQAIVNRWAKTTFPGNMWAFYRAFNPWNGTMNFKATSPIFDSFGNYIYGWSGTVGGYPWYLLQGVGSATHFGFNNEINVLDIQSGIDDAMTGGTISVVPVSNSDF